MIRNLRSINGNLMPEEMTEIGKEVVGSIFLKGLLGAVDQHPKRSDYT